MLRTKTKKHIPLLIQWLNATQGARNQHFVSLLETAQQIAALTISGGTLPFIDLVTWKARGNREQMANAKRLFRLGRKLDRQFARYEMYPTATPKSRGQWHLGWRSASRFAKDVPVFVFSSGERFSFGEQDALMSLLNLMRREELGKVRECLHCGRWFFARVRHQNYCELKCQQSYFRTNPAFRNKRRMYMQGYRRDKAERNKREDALWRNQNRR
jgi:hypothetical protein